VHGKAPLYLKENNRSIISGLASMSSLEGRDGAYCKNDATLLGK